MKSSYYQDSPDAPVDPWLLHERAVEALEEAWRDPASVGGSMTGRHAEPLAKLRDQAHAPGVANPLWDIVRLLPAEDYWGRPAVSFHPFLMGPKGVYFALAYGVDRQTLVQHFAWSIPSPGDMEWLRSVLGGRMVVEVGAGSGYWKYVMEQCGIKVAAYDISGPGDNHWFSGPRTWAKVRIGGPEVAARYRWRALMLCWAPYEKSVARDALAAFKGDLVITMGEGEGGCVADDEFWQELNGSWDCLGTAPDHVTWEGIHCYLQAWRRKPVGPVKDAVPDTFRS